MQLESYDIHGIYPDGARFYAQVYTQSVTDAIAIAQGIRKVTTVHTIWIDEGEEHTRRFYDSLF